MRLAAVGLILLLAAPVHARIVASRRACHTACAATVQRCAVNRSHADPPAPREVRTCRRVFEWYCRHDDGPSWCASWWAENSSSP